MSLSVGLLINLIPFTFLLGNPPPFSPHLIKEGEVIDEREASPLFDPLVYLDTIPCIKWLNKNGPWTALCRVSAIIHETVYNVKVI
ncbi:hypothetical protein ES703_108491 [subsurface metagenome]